MDEVTTTVTLGERVTEEIGLAHLHLHMLRHTFCSAMLAAGHDALILRDLMGHASVVTTQGYAHVTSTQRRRAVASIDALLREAA